MCYVPVFAFELPLSLLLLAFVFPLLLSVSSFLISFELDGFECESAFVVVASVSDCSASMSLSSAKNGNTL